MHASKLLLLVQVVVLLEASVTAYNPAFDYNNARRVRTLQGHEAAQPLYQELLLKHQASDRSAATRIAASPSTLQRQDQACTYEITSIFELRSLLHRFNYTNAAVQDVLRVPTNLRAASCPIYASPIMAGSTISENNLPPTPSTACECLVSLFLLGIAVPESTVQSCFAGIASIIPLLESLGLAFLEDQVLVPYVHIYPLELYGSPLWFVTDLHPKCLSATTVGTSKHHAVMYIGPDSLALVQHYLQHLMHDKMPSPDATVLDVCAGSGIQGLCTAATNSMKNQDPHECPEVVFVDTNPRALKFVKFNAALNQIPSKIRLVLGDVVTGNYQVYDADDEHTAVRLPTKVDLLLANPPFIPVPPSVAQERYGLFSSGGSSGEVVLWAILKQLLHGSDVQRVAIVSEFMNPDTFCQRLLLQLQDAMSGVLLTNEYPISADTYAARRADSQEEYAVWKQHLDNADIETVSPGLLILEQQSDAVVEHDLVPKTQQGSIWTPSNMEAVAFTRQALIRRGLLL